MIKLIYSNPAPYSGVLTIHAHAGADLHARKIATLRRYKNTKEWEVALPDDISGTGATIRGGKMVNGLTLAEAKELSTLMSQHASATTVDAMTKAVQGDVNWSAFRARVIARRMKEARTTGQGVSNS